MYVWARTVDAMKSATTTKRFATTATLRVAVSLHITVTTAVIKIDGT
jgi:hypothetical protein